MPNTKLPQTPQIYIKMEFKLPAKVNMDEHKRVEERVRNFWEI